jgi:hypothetical protein
MTFWLFATILTVVVSEVEEDVEAEPSSVAILLVPPGTKKKKGREDVKISKTMLRSHLLVYYSYG